MKKCTKCGKKKEINEKNFRKGSKYGGGFSTMCIVCANAYQLNRKKQKGDWLKIIIG